MAVVVGSVLSLMAKSTYDSAFGGPECNHTIHCSASGASQSNTAHSEAAGSTIAFVVGGALLAASAAKGGAALAAGAAVSGSASSAGTSSGTVAAWGVVAKWIGGSAVAAVVTAGAMGKIDMPHPFARANVTQAPRQAPAPPAARARGDLPRKRERWSESANT